MFFTNDLSKGYFELTDFDWNNKRTMHVGFKRDEKCRLAEIFLFQLDDKSTIKSVIKERYCV